MPVVFRPTPAPRAVAGLKPTLAPAKSALKGRPAGTTVSRPASMVPQVFKAAGG